MPADDPNAPLHTLLAGFAIAPEVLLVQYMCGIRHRWGRAFAALTPSAAAHMPFKAPERGPVFSLHMYPQSHINTLFDAYWHGFGVWYTTKGETAPPPIAADIAKRQLDDCSYAVKKSVARSFVWDATYEECLEGIVEACTPTVLHGAGVRYVVVHIGTPIIAVDDDGIPQKKRPASAAPV
jgi:hypothetical protein